MYLVGDIGGTKTHLALFDHRKSVREKKYVSNEYSNLNEIVRDFLSEGSEKIQIVVLGIAGPVEQGRVETMNLPWVIDSRELGQKIVTDRVFLLNDLQANAYGIRALSDDEFCVLNQGVSLPGNAALISAGTGLGEAGLYWDGKNHHPFACEGGHSDFAPRNELEIELWQYLHKKYEHVSFERVLAGSAIYDLYLFLIETGKEKHTEEMQEEFRKKDPSIVISEKGVSGDSSVCERVMEWFTSLYGTEAGNMALKFLSFSGLYIGGGIAPKILKKMKEKHFMEAFIAKGRLRDLLAQIPIKIILNDRTALLGAVEFAILKGGLI